MDTDNPTLENYYARRAGEYEQIYHRDDPQRQQEQLELQVAMKVVLQGANVLEVACGTGYWTQFLSEAAATITATDFNREVLDIAKTKSYSCPVALRQADAYNLPFTPASFTGGLANFWLSHVPKHRIDEFLKGFHSTLKPGSHIIIADNMNVAGVGGTLITKPGDENTYKLRTLNDGTQQEVLKNYFAKEELLQLFSKYDTAFTESNVCVGKCFWWVRYRV